MSGYFKLIIGPMYAGKSTELLRSINKYKILNKKIVVINHIINNRYGSTKLITHDKKEYDDCIILENLGDLEQNYKDIFESCDVIIIEELQFATYFHLCCLIFEEIFILTQVCFFIITRYESIIRLAAVWILIFFYLPQCDSPLELAFL